MLINNNDNKDLTVSSKTVKSPTRERDNEFWTHAHFKDELFIHLTRIKDSNKPNSVSSVQQRFLSDFKYYVQAARLIYRIPITKRTKLVPPFIINTKDLESNPKLYLELKEFIALSTEKQIAFFLKEIAVKFFEAIHYGYTHNSVIQHIAVRIE